MDQPEKGPAVALGALVGGIVGGALGAGAGALIGENFHHWSTVYRSDRTQGSILVTPEGTGVSLTMHF